jgi:TrmH family RNA methyltransferase
VTASPVVSLKRAARLRLKKHREAGRLFLAEGESLVNEAPGPPVRLFTDRREIEKVSTLKTPVGPVGVFPFLDIEAEELLRRSSLITLLCGVQDPGNVGTIIRAAHAFGAGVTLSRGCADLYNPKTVRATMGSIFHVPVARELDPVAFLDLAKERGYGAVAAVPEGGAEPRSVRWEQKILVIGSEGAGLLEEVEAACEARVGIPIRASSLNAATAAAILLYEARRRVLP